MFLIELPCWLLGFPFPRRNGKFGKVSSAEGNLVTPQEDKWAGESPQRSTSSYFMQQQNWQGAQASEKLHITTLVLQCILSPYLHISHKRYIFRVQLLKAYMLIFLQIYYVWMRSVYSFLGLWRICACNPPLVLMTDLCIISLTPRIQGAWLSHMQLLTHTMTGSWDWGSGSWVWRRDFMFSHFRGLCSKKKNAKNEEICLSQNTYRTFHGF